jgi:hypothetical protein
MTTGLDREALEMALEAIRDFAKAKLPARKLLECDANDEVPIDVVRAMCSDKLGIQLLFIREEYNGMGGGTFDVYRVCEAMAAIDLGVATGVAGAELIKPDLPTTGFAAGRTRPGRIIEVWPYPEARNMPNLHAVGVGGRSPKGGVPLHAPRPQAAN